MIIKLTHAQKVALLEAVKSGELDTDVLDIKGRDQKTPREIETEIFRIEMMQGREIMYKRGELMQRYGSGELTNEEYIAAQLDISIQQDNTNH